MSDIPRRIRIDLQTPAEAAIRAAVDAVEAVGCDPRLTEAVLLLDRARGMVADVVDNVVLPPPGPPKCSHVQGGTPGIICGDCAVALGILLASQEQEVARVMRWQAKAKAAISKGGRVSLSTVWGCSFCGDYGFADEEAQRAHAARCPNHPAAERADRAETERDAYRQQATTFAEALVALGRQDIVDVAITAAGLKQEGYPPEG